MFAEEIKNHIILKEGASDWETAVREAAGILLKEGYVTPHYIDAMVDNIKKHGDYVVILPGFAMPHARPEEGANRTGYAMLKLEHPVVFPEGSEISVILALAASDPEAHLDAIAELTDLLMDDDKMQQLFQAHDESNILELL